MEQRDHLQKQIDQLGKVLARLFGDMLGLKSQGKTAQSLAITNEVLQDELDLKLDDLTALAAEEFIETLQHKKKFSRENLDKLADILLFMADELHGKAQDKEKSQNLYQKCLQIYTHLNNTDETYSFDRHFKIEKIKNRIR